MYAFGCYYSKFYELVQLTNRFFKFEKKNPIRSAMLPNTKQKQKSHQNDVVRLEPSISMPSLASKPHLSVTKNFDMRRSNWNLKQKTTAETISETRRMLSNGAYLFAICQKDFHFSSLHWNKNNRKKAKQKPKKLPLAIHKHSCSDSL